MKACIMKFLFTLFIINSAVIVYSQDSTEKQKALVRVVQGYEVYIMSEPMRDYIEITTIKSGAKSGMVSPNIEKMVKVITNKIERAERKVGKVDGFITSDGNTVRLIVFKD